ncbi:nuclease-related domain-containing protein [Neisseria wadsworthii]|uniref:nuclease-related domain-containing protein n=1 Tax=Neisseria wadsworthii TaxID=607711 RepID=UPI001F43C0D7|nr:nuclease-related domain-containing protein [Neisseria wadsworthii]
MRNYYEKKYQTLRENNSNALFQIVEILLYQSTPPRVPENSNKFQVFWQSDFISELTSIHLKNENYRIAFAQYVRYGKIDLLLCQTIADICPESFVIAIRKSGIISKIQHESWPIIKELCSTSKKHELHDFISIVEYLQHRYQKLLNTYNALKQKINLGQITIMLYSSLYTYEHLLAESNPGNHQVTIPYQVDSTCPVTIDDLCQAFDAIIRQTSPAKKTITEKSLALLCRNKLMPFLVGEGLTPLLIQEYEQFKQLVALRVELSLYRNFVFNTYSYQEKTEYSLCNEKLRLHTSEKADACEFFDEKFSIIGAYWRWRGMQECQETPYFLRMDRGKNLKGNLIALSETQAVILRLQEVFGIYEHISNQQHFDLFEAVLSLMLSQQFYRADFISKFTDMQKEGIHPFEALFLLLAEGVMIGENRLPVTFSEKNHKAERMSNWILTSSNSVKKKKAEAILDFWSQNLREMYKGSFQELPYYQIDNIVLSLPHRFAIQNLHTSVINHFRKLNKNRATLLQETSRMEKQLGDLFKKHGWQVFVQHMPESNNVGEIDLIVISDKHVLVIELKSSFIKQSIREIYEYQYFVLKKAAYQLSRKCAYIKNTLLPKLGYSSEQLLLHSWIVDTTLEFDHQYIDGHLKISLEELLIHLNQHSDFMERFFEKENSNNLQEIAFSSLIKDIEQDCFWQNELPRFSGRLKDLEARFG